MLEHHLIVAELSKIKKAKTLQLKIIKKMILSWKSLPEQKQVYREMVEAYPPPLKGHRSTMAYKAIFLTEGRAKNIIACTIFAHECSSNGTNEKVVPQGSILDQAKNTFSASRNQGETYLLSFIGFPSIFQTCTMFWLAQHVIQVYPFEGQIKITKFFFQNIDFSF